MHQASPALLIRHIYKPDSRLSLNSSPTIPTHQNQPEVIEPRPARPTSSITAQTCPTVRSRLFLRLHVFINLASLDAEAEAAGGRETAKTPAAAIGDAVEDGFAVAASGASRFADFVLLVGLVCAFVLV